MQITYIKIRLICNEEHIFLIKTLDLQALFSTFAITNNLKLSYQEDKRQEDLRSIVGAKIDMTHYSYSKFIHQS